MNREAAWILLTEFNKESFHLQHAQTVGDVMKWYAQEMGYAEEADFWEVVGILHDLDFEQYPEEHCVREESIMRERGVDERLIRAAVSHGYGMTETTVKPEHTMEKVLYAVDELTGLIGAAALMRPSKSVSDMEVKSLKKKFKDKKFAAGCSRDTILCGAELLGMDLDTLLERTLEAMRASENKAD